MNSKIMAMETNNTDSRKIKRMMLFSMTMPVAAHSGSMPALFCKASKSRLRNDCFYAFFPIYYNIYPFSG